MKCKWAKNITVIAAALIIILIPLICGGAVFASAASASATAIEDLRKDEKFNALEYIDNALDTSVKVIQIAESDSGGLVVYTYQPSQRTRYLIATSINMSLSESADYTQNYALKLLDISGVIGKYKVTGFKVSEKPVRYYNITSIYRAWDKRIDLEPGNDNTVTEVAFAVGQLWTVQTAGGQIYYSAQDIEVLEVSAQTVGFRRYSNGINPLIMHGSACDAHFFAFSTRREIDKLLNADLEYKTQPFEISKGVKTLGSKTPHIVTLTADEYAENPAGGWLGKKAKWDRIASTEEFLNCGLEFTADEQKLFSGYQWVLNFCETEFDVTKNTGFLIPVLESWFTGDQSYMVTSSGTRVSEVTLLRLEFEHDGDVYNLGVVSDKQTGSDKPTNAGQITGVPWYFWLIFGVAVIVVLVILGIIFPPFGKILLSILKDVWLVISFPFRLIGKGIIALSERAQKRKQTPKRNPAKRKKSGNARKHKARAKK